ncbi:SRPBCC family protein [Ekhidna sp.]
MKVHVQRQMRSQTSVLWKYLSDFPNIGQFNPLLKSSKCIAGSIEMGKGAERHCVMVDGSDFKERVTAWEEGKFYTVEVFETSMPLKSARATMGVASIDKRLSMAYLHMELEPKFNILKPFMFLVFRFLAGPAVLRGLDKISLQERKAIAAFSGFVL